MIYCIKVSDFWIYYFFKFLEKWNNIKGAQNAHHAKTIRTPEQQHHHDTKKECASKQPIRSREDKVKVARRVS